MGVDDWISVVAILLRERFGLELSDIGGDPIAPTMFDDVTPNEFVECIGIKYGLADLTASRRCY
jgi:hypothetical protein